MKKHIVLSLLVCLISGASSVSMAMNPPPECQENIKEKHRNAKKPRLPLVKNSSELPENIKEKHRNAKKNHSLPFRQSAHNTCELRFN